jgi:uncharacterized protein (TIGR01777 family)
MDKILIAGGTGTIGTLLSHHLASRGYQVRLLSRRKDTNASFPTYKWDISGGYIDPAALKDLDIVINLAGAGIVDRRWTSARKKILKSSRIDGNTLLAEKLSANKQKVKLFIGASAIGIYGNRGSELITEESGLEQSGYLVDLCQAWETSHQAFSALAERVVSLRIGLVLARGGGVLPAMKAATIGGIGAYFGSGTQFMPWIHIKDLCRMVEFIISPNSSLHIYNAVGPHPVTNKRFIKKLVRLKGGLGWIIPIPFFFLRLFLGERAAAILDGAKVLPKAALNEGFSFSFENLEEALNDLI